MQTRRVSAIETIVSTAAGFLVSLLLTFTVLPSFGYAVTSGHAWGITAIYTAASLLRGYVVRRVFNVARAT
jgi:polyferredoxin